MGEITFRLVGNFQYRENYGAHAWDGKGECPQYWKYKGGESVNFLVGVVDQSDKYIRLVEEQMAEEIKKYEWSDQWSEQYFIGWHWECTQAWTEKEEIDAYCDWHEDLFAIPEDVPEVDHYAMVAASLGYVQYW